MSKLAENNVDYYEFLSVIHEASKNSQSIQNDSIKKVYQNYDLRLYKMKLEKEIEELDKLIDK